MRSGAAQLHSQACGVQVHAALKVSFMCDKTVLTGPCGQSEGRPLLNFWRREVKTKAPPAVLERKFSTKPVRSTLMFQTA